MTRIGWMGIAVLCTSCVTTRPYSPPALENATPNRWPASADTGDAPDFTWWNDFGDTGLGDVVRTALEQNYDLQAAAARLEPAAADSRIAAADQTVKTWFAIAEAQQQVRLAETTVASFSTSSDQVREFAEVETALAAEEFLAERERHLQTSVEQSRAAESLADDRYRTALEDYVTVLESQRLALQAEGDLIGARRQRLENRVDLYQALGGGFDQLASPVTVSRP